MRAWLASGVMIWMGKGAWHFWAIVDPAKPMVPRHVCVLGIGHPLQDGTRYVGSVVTSPFTWHVFVRLTPDEILRDLIRL